MERTQRQATRESKWATQILAKLEMIQRAKIDALHEQANRENETPCLHCGAAGGHDEGCSIGEAHAEAIKEEPCECDGCGRRWPEGYLVNVDTHSGEGSFCPEGCLSEFQGRG